MIKNFFLIFCLFIPNSYAVSIVKGPYIDNLSDSELAIRYVLDSQSLSWLGWGEFPKCDRYVIPMVPRVNNSVNVYGIRPGKKYCYNVYLPLSASTNSYISSSSTFTSFYDESISSFSFVAFSNNGFNSDEENVELSSSVASLKNDYMFIIHTGNISSSGMIDDTDKKFFIPFLNIINSKPVFISPGPQEYGDERNKAKGYKIFKENYASYHSFAKNGLSPHYYYVDISKARFIFIDNNSFNDIAAAPLLVAGSKQYIWLEGVLKYSKDKKWIFVVLNYPLYPSASASNDIKDLEELFIKYNVDIVFQNGSSYYLRTKPVKYGVYDDKGIIYITLGGSENYLTPSYDQENIDTNVEKKVFLYTNIDGDKIDITAYDYSLNQIDRFVLNK